MITAEINGEKVIFKGGGLWQSDDPVLTGTLEALEIAYWAGRPVYAPDRDRAIIDFIVSQIGGRVVSASTPPADPAGSVF